MKDRCLFNKWTALLLFLLGVCSPAWTQRLALPCVLSSNMVLQQGRDVPVWGTAAPGERVTVTFAGKQYRVRANQNGEWSTQLPAMQASFTPQRLVVKGKDSTIVCDNILIGEVWLCSGQSNMAYKMRRGKYNAPLKGNDLAAEELKKPVNPKIRLFVVRRDGKPASWHEAGGDDLAESSAVGYYFGKQLQEQLNVPVGILTSAVGGTRIEAWTSEQSYRDSPLFADELKKGKGSVDGKGVGDLYEKMIVPLAPFAVKGFLWYQGESNLTDLGRERRYAEKFNLLTTNWRTLFKVQEAPFYYVLLAPYLYSARNPKNKGVPSTAEELPLFWQQQMRMQQTISNIDYVSVWDMVDNVSDIHPSYKWRVGERLSRLALAKDYGKSDLEYSGPRATEVEQVGDSLMISFSHTAKGLQSDNRKRLDWFEIAGEDGVFRSALADVCNTSRVKVWHPDVKCPLYVRFGWHETAMPNLVNSENLPAFPFMLSVQKQTIVDR